MIKSLVKILLAIFFYLSSSNAWSSDEGPFQFSADQYGFSVVCEVSPLRGEGGRPRGATFLLGEDEWAREEKIFPEGNNRERYRTSREGTPDNQGANLLEEETREPHGTAPGQDWKGMRRDTAFFLLYQPLIVGTFYLLPESVIGYTREQKKLSAHKWGDHILHPDWDRDAFWLNFIAHPYWGASFYIRARERGFSRLGGFAYAALLSAVFEFATESLFERPSYNDLIVTPLLGSFVGAVIFEPVRDYIRSKPRLAWYDHVVLGATDLLGTANKYMERLLGTESTIRVHYRPSAESRHDPRGEMRFLRGQGFGLEYIVAW